MGLGNFIPLRTPTTHLLTLEGKPDLPSTPALATCPDAPMVKSSLIVPEISLPVFLSSSF